MAATACFLEATGREYSIRINDQWFETNIAPALAAFQNQLVMVGESDESQWLATLSSPSASWEGGPPFGPSNPEL